MGTDITKMSVTELKALAYDELGKMEVAQKNLQIINVEIAKKMESKSESPAVEAIPVEESNI